MKRFTMVFIILNIFFISNAIGVELSAKSLYELKTKTVGGPKVVNPYEMHEIYRENELNFSRQFNSIFFIEGTVLRVRKGYDYYCVDLECCKDQLCCLSVLYPLNVNSTDLTFLRNLKSGDFFKELVLGRKDSCGYVDVAGLFHNGVFYLNPPKFTENNILDPFAILERFETESIYWEGANFSKEISTIDEFDYWMSSEFFSSVKCMFNLIDFNELLKPNIRVTFDRNTKYTIYNFGLNKYENGILRYANDMVFVSSDLTIIEEIKKIIENFAENKLQYHSFEIDGSLRNISTEEIMKNIENFADIEQNTTVDVILSCFLGNDYKLITYPVREYKNGEFIYVISRKEFSK